MKKGNRIKNKKKQNRQFVIGCICSAILIVVIIIAFALINAQNKTEESSYTQGIDNDTSNITIPDNLIIFNKCRILKMVDDYNAIKGDRTKREYFNTYNVIDNETIPCLEERSQNSLDFASRINDVWENRKNENFINSTQTPEYFLKDLNDKCKKNITISKDRDTELKYFALYYAYWGTLGNFDPNLNHFMSYQYARDLVFEAGATYTANNDGFVLSITLPNSNQEIVVTQNTDKDSAPTPIATSKWGSGWWNNK